MAHTVSLRRDRLEGQATRATCGAVDPCHAWQHRVHRPADRAGLWDLHRSAPGPARRPGALRRRAQRGYGLGHRAAVRRRQETLIMGRNAQRRRAARAARRQPAQSRPVLFYDVELWHLDDELELSWSAEGAINGDSSGARFESTDTLAELVADVVDEVREISQARGGT